MAPPLNLALGIEDPGARLLAATIEQAVKDLAAPAEAEDAAEFLREIVPAFWHDLGAAQVEELIAYRRRVKYNVTHEARTLEGTTYTVRGRLRSAGKAHARAMQVLP